MYFFEARRYSSGWAFSALLFSALLAVLVSLLFLACAALDALSIAGARAKCPQRSGGYMNLPSSGAGRNLQLPVF